MAAGNRLLFSPTLSGLRFSSAYACVGGQSSALASTSTQNHMEELLMNTTSLTVHARRRSRQRGIGLHAIENVLNHGRTYAVGKGCVAYFLGQRVVDNIRRTFGSRLDQFQNLAVLLAPDGQVVTVEHMHGTLPNHWRAL